AARVVVVNYLKEDLVVIDVIAMAVPVFAQPMVVEGDHRPGLVGGSGSAYVAGSLGWTLIDHEMEVGAVHAWVVADHILDVGSGWVIVAGAVQREAEREFVSHHETVAPSYTVQIVEQSVGLLGYC